MTPYSQMNGVSSRPLKTFWSNSKGCMLSLSLSEYIPTIFPPTNTESLYYDTFVIQKHKTKPCSQEKLITSWVHATQHMTL